MSKQQKAVGKPYEIIGKLHRKVIHKIKYTHYKITTAFELLVFKIMHAWNNYNKNNIEVEIVIFTMRSLFFQIK